MSPRGRWPVDTLVGLTTNATGVVCGTVEVRERSTKRLPNPEVYQNLHTHGSHSPPLQPETWPATYNTTFSSRGQVEVRDTHAEEYHAIATTVCVEVRRPTSFAASLMLVVTLHT